MTHRRARQRRRANPTRHLPGPVVGRRSGVAARRDGTPDTLAPVAPHAYVPSAMHMGDCAICGHLQDAAIHRAPPPGPYHPAFICHCPDKDCTGWRRAASLGGGHVTYEEAMALLRRT